MEAATSQEQGPRYTTRHLSKLLLIPAARNPEGSLNKHPQHTRRLAKTPGEDVHLQHILCEVLGMWASEPDPHLWVDLCHSLQQLCKLHGAIPLGFTQAAEPWRVHRRTASAAGLPAAATDTVAACSLCFLLLLLQVRQVCIGVDVLPQKSDLLDAVLRQLLHLAQYRVNRPAALPAPREGDDTKGAHCRTATADSQEPSVSTCAGHTQQQGC